ncbi:Ribosome association toxin PasT (RatA) of the RatAB toxin-antitoxin module [Methylobacillus rhizosphaerae]|uniref:Ribosome association toxin PasT (RatA) of the RatAB toxin-antitoxin module n=1 Tax=Methylobacillus rhizosphaerae TaxID=551994 RepID=A0A238YSZ5_9PROT|nr:type II toxin-antitoxin system RatA family toxin [Methylobacillus rhizosphaerae]SNR74170.1 Ribosome association toxin PasT (RatA) of the RatAB toxin-antitoxin module [Methylobacillus rhizosphaerae]
MAQVEKTVLVGHSAEHMFNLVDNVEAYPGFLPWCGGVDLLQRDESVTAATLHIDYHGLKQHFTTENHKTFPTSMEIRLKNGPFKHLEGFWRFTPLAENACKIEFKLQYEFSSFLLEKLIAPVFSHIANTFVEAFVQQADNVAP